MTVGVSSREERADQSEARHHARIRTFPRARNATPKDIVSGAGQSERGLFHAAKWDSSFGVVSNPTG